MKKTIIERQEPAAHTASSRSGTWDSGTIACRHRVDGPGLPSTVSWRMPVLNFATYTIARDEIQAGYAVAVLGMIVLAIWLKLGSKTAKVGSDEKHSNATSGV